MTEQTQPASALTDEALAALLRRAIRDTLLLGIVASLVLLIGSGWRNAAMLATGAAISAASILEWQRLIRLINNRLDKQKLPRKSAVVVLFFLLRLFIFGAAIYGSLKCFQGSLVALLCGLGLAVLAMTWGALRLLKA